MTKTQIINLAAEIAPYFDRYTFKAGYTLNCILDLALEAGYDFRGNFSNQDLDFVLPAFSVWSN